MLPGGTFDRWYILSDNSVFQQMGLVISPIVGGVPEFYQDGYRLVKVVRVLQEWADLQPELLDDPDSLFPVCTFLCSLPRWQRGFFNGASGWQLLI